MDYSQTEEIEYRPNYYAVPLSFFKEGDTLDKDLYLLYQGNYILFQRAGAALTGNDTQKLIDFDVSDLYILAHSASEYCDYMDIRMSQVLESKAVPIEQKGKLIYTASLAAIDGLMQKPESMEKARQNISFVKHCVQYLQQDKQAFYELFKNSVADMSEHAHGLHVAAYATTLAKHLGYDSPKDQIAVGIGAVLHDIGKTKVPREILLKPGRLTDSEMFEVRKHSQYGYDISEKYGRLIPNESRAIILQHHERCDGKGYPRKLPSSLIHPFSKIVRIADIFDAMTSARPYRDRISAVGTAQELLQTATTDEERQLVVKFVEMMK